MSQTFLIACNKVYDSSITLVVPDGSIFDDCTFDDCTIIGNPSRISITNCRFNGRAADWCRKMFPHRN
jgi:hypothetical protein